jgi:uncharacterized protein (TIGR02271 family)
MTDESSEARIPLVEERPRIDKRIVETGVITIRTTIDEHTERLTADLLHEEVGIERVPIDREVSEAPEIRWEGEVLIIPVLEERVVVQKRCVLVEELHVRRQRRHEAAEIPVALKATSVSVERKKPLSGDQNP